VAVELTLPGFVYSQEAIAAELESFGGPVFARFARTSGVEKRHLALPLERYAALSGFTEANDAYIEVALELGERAIASACERAGIGPGQIDLIASTTVTGLAVPSLEARLAGRLGLKPEVKRLPLFGLGCVAGAAGVARLHDYLRAFPDHVAVLLAVELCSLTVQRQDQAPANLVAASLFGDGAAAVVMAGGEVDAPGPLVVASRSRLYPDTRDVMGWDIGTDGFRIVLSTEVAPIAERFLPDDVQGFLKDEGVDQISAWICHPGGPKVIAAIERGLGLPRAALDRTRESLRYKGNLSSASVLDVLGATMRDPPAAGEYGLMMAMGPGFCSELVLLRW
jgi:alkylresorcinol/alkylpyrone synthase